MKRGHCSILKGIYMDVVLCQNTYLTKVALLLYTKTARVTVGKCKDSLTYVPQL
jgi:hypothetical protein